MQVNVVDGVAGTSFGTEPWFTYIEEMPHYLTHSDKLASCIPIGFALFTAFDSHFPKKNEFQTLLIFILANLAILSSVAHKETRFMA